MRCLIIFVTLFSFLTPAKLPAQENILNLLIFHDSIIAYNGIDQPTGAVTKLTHTGSKISKLIQDNKEKFGTSLMVEIKIAGEAGIGEKVKDVIDLIKKENLIYQVVDPGEMDKKIFHMQGLRWDFRNESMNLKLPRGQKADEVKADENTYTILLMNDSAYTYLFNNWQQAKKFELENFTALRKDLLEQKKKIGDKKIKVIIRPSATANYTQLIGLIDEMMINEINQYGVDDVDKIAKDHFHAQSFMDMVTVTGVNATQPMVLPDTPVEENTVMIRIDKNDKVFFSVLYLDNSIPKNLLKRIDSVKKLNLSRENFERFDKIATIGVPFSQLKKLLELSPDQQKTILQPGIPVDSTGGELTDWIAASNTAFTGNRVVYLIQGSNSSTYTTFKKVIEALRKNDLYKYRLVTIDD